MRWQAAVVMVTLALPASAGADADRLLVGGLVHTPSGVLPLAVAIRNGKIAAVVDNEAAAAWKGENTEVVDLAGAHVLPGLVDAHLHLTGYGASLEEVNLAGAASWEDVLGRVEAGAIDLPPGAWLLGRGWDQNLWPDKQFPDRAELDARFPERPVLLSRVDGHAVIANRPALEAAGIGRDSQAPAGGRILRRADGDLTGVLVDAAASLVEKAVPHPSAADVERQQLRACSSLAALGLTGVHDAGTTVLELDVLRRLAAEKRLPIRVYVLLEGSDDEQMARELAHPPDAAPAAMLRVGGVKLYADGALGSRGALLSADYSDDPGNRGLAVLSFEELERQARAASRAGYQVAVHAIGDEAVHRVLDVFSRLGRGSCRKLRHRVEHSQTVRPEDVARYARLGVIASVQPTHCTSDMPWADERLGPERIAWAYRWRSLLAAGVALAGGSDAPVEDPDPRRGLYAAVTRQQSDGLPPGGWNPAERLSAAEALRLFTQGAAWAARAEDWSGTIEAGKVADLTVVADDPISADPVRVLQMPVVRTLVGGEDRFVAFSPASTTTGGR